MINCDLGQCNQGEIIKSMYYTKCVLAHLMPKTINNNYVTFKNKFLFLFNRVIKSLIFKYLLKLYV